MEIPRHWRLRAQRYRLEGSICPICGRLSFPPRLVCPRCAVQPVQSFGLGFSILPVSKRVFDIVPLKG
jgi:uncharacterized OB-fold protein